MSKVHTAIAELASLLDDSLAPVYVLDDNRRIVYCNRACARWLGVGPHDLLGERCAYNTETDDGSPAAIARGLCPPPKAFSGEPQVAVVSVQSAGGRAIHRRGNFLPLSDGDDESAPVVAVLETSDCAADAADAEGDADARLHEQLRRLRRGMAARYRIDRLLGVSPGIERARTQCQVAAETAASVLIVGPKGSGKDHVARAIHYAQRQPGALVALACDVLNANLLRSALRSAWSPAAAAASSVTLVLNDVDCMPPEAQADLAELLARGGRPVRVIATSTRPLAPLAAGEGFSPVVACALSTLTIELAPLCERPEDLPLLAQAILEEANLESNKQIGGITRDALDQLAAYAWPDNVDELAGIVRQAHERATGGEITASDLPKQISWAAESGAHPKRTDDAIVLEEFLARVERELITRAMRRAKNNKSKAARLLGLTRPRLYRRLIQLGLEQANDDEVE